MYGKDKATLALVWARVGQPYPTRYPHVWGVSGRLGPDSSRPNTGIPEYHICLIEGSLTHHTLLVAAVGPSSRHG